MPTNPRQDCVAWILHVYQHVTQRQITRLAREYERRSGLKPGEGFKRFSWTRSYLIKSKRDRAQGHFGQK